MSTGTSILHRAMAGTAAAAIIMGVLTSYFYAPAAQSITTVLA